MLDEVQANYIYQIRVFPMSTAFVYIIICFDCIHFLPFLIEIPVACEIVVYEVSNNALLAGARACKLEDTCFTPPIPC
jgi:hypothetical protein